MTAMSSADRLRRCIVDICSFGSWLTLKARTAQTRSWDQSLAAILGVVERHTEFLPAAFDIASHYTAFDMIVYEPHGLHEGIDRCGADELPSLLFQCL